MKEKLAKLLKYKTMMVDRLSSAVPQKHKDHPETYKNFLKNEIRMVTLQIDALKEGK